jgi:hypothetical protein
VPANGNQNPSGFATADDNTSSLDLWTFEEKSRSRAGMDHRDVDEVFRLLGSGALRHGHHGDSDDSGGGMTAT